MIYTQDLRDAEVGLTSEQLDELYNPDGGGQHPVFTRSTWQQEVANGDTVSGYWEWLYCQIQDWEPAREIAKMEKILFAPGETLQAFGLVKRRYPDLLVVSYDADMRWLYQLKDGSSPAFRGEFDVDLLGFGADALTRSEVSYFAMEYTLPETLTLLWEALGREPVDEEGCTERPFLSFVAGTDVQTIWKWFEAQHPDFSVAKGGL